MKNETPSLVANPVPRFLLLANRRDRHYGASAVATLFHKLGAIPCFYPCRGCLAKENRFYGRLNKKDACNERTAQKPPRSRQKSAVVEE